MREAGNDRCSLALDCQESNILKAKLSILNDKVTKLIDLYVGYRRAAARNNQIV